MSDYGKTKSFMLIPSKDFEKIKTETKDEDKTLLDLFAKLKNLEQMNTKSNKLINKNSVSDLYNELKRSELVDDRYKSIINSENLPDSLKLNLYSKFQNMERNDNISNSPIVNSTEKEIQTEDVSKKSSIPFMKIHKLTKTGHGMAIEVINNLEKDGIIQIQDDVIVMGNIFIPIKDFIRIIFVKGSKIDPQYENFISKIISHIDPEDVTNMRVKKLFDKKDLSTDSILLNPGNKSHKNIRGAGLKRWTVYV